MRMVRFVENNSRHGAVFMELANNLESKSGAAGLAFLD